MTEKTCETEQVQLTLPNLYGLFILYAIICGIALLTFGAERAGYSLSTPFVPLLFPSFALRPCPSTLITGGLASEQEDGGSLEPLARG